MFSSQKIVLPQPLDTPVVKIVKVDHSVFANDFCILPPGDTGDDVLYLLLQIDPVTRGLHLDMKIVEQRPETLQQTIGAIPEIRIAKVEVPRILEEIFHIDNSLHRHDDTAFGIVVIEMHSFTRYTVSYPLAAGFHGVVPDEQVMGLFVDSDPCCLRARCGRTVAIEGVAFQQNTIGLVDRETFAVEENQVVFCQISAVVMARLRPSFAGIVPLLDQKTVSLIDHHRGKAFFENMGDDTAFVAEKEVVDDFDLYIGKIVRLSDVLDHQPSGTAGAPPGVVIDDIVSDRDIVALFGDLDPVSREISESAVFDEKMADLGVESPLLGLFGRVPPAIDDLPIVHAVSLASEV